MEVRDVLGFRKNGSSILKAAGFGDLTRAWRGSAQRGVGEESYEAVPPRRFVEACVALGDAYGFATCPDRAERAVEYGQ